jgi:hypothetical protein
LVQQPKKKYKTTHPLYGDRVEFDTLEDLIEYTIDAAEKHVMKAAKEALADLADYMLSSVREVYES